jgi:hypothetical protein
MPTKSMYAVIPSTILDIVRIMKHIDVHRRHERREEFVTSDGIQSHTYYDS